MIAGLLPLLQIMAPLQQVRVDMGLLILAALSRH